MRKRWHFIFRYRTWTENKFNLIMRMTVYYLWSKLFDTQTIFSQFLSVIKALWKLKQTRNLADNSLFGGLRFKCNNEKKYHLVHWHLSQLSSVCAIRQNEVLCLREPDPLPLLNKEFWEKNIVNVEKKTVKLEERTYFCTNLGTLRILLNKLDPSIKEKKSSCRPV